MRRLLRGVFVYALVVGFVRWLMFAPTRKRPTSPSDD